MKHLQDNTKPFGLLSEEEREYLGGLDSSEIQFFNGIKWADKWNKNFSSTNTYRVKPRPLTKPSIDWSHVHEDYNWMATDKSGVTYLYTDKPEICIRSNQFTAGKFTTHARAFASFKEGTCDWTESLVQRPNDNT